HQRHRGLELSTFGELTPEVKIIGGLSLLETDASGLKAIGAPKTQANVGLEWTTPFAPGLSFDGRLLHTSSQHADAANTQDVPSWTRFDLGVRYLFTFAESRTVTLRARLEN